MLIYLNKNASLIFIAFLILLIGCDPEIKVMQKSSLQELEENFKDPPIEARPRAYWVWVNGNFDRQRITYELREAKAKGMGGYDIWDIGAYSDPENKIPAGPAFMGEESSKAIAHAINTATELGLEIGLVNASSWNAGGSWVKAENGVKGILDTTIVITGPEKQTVKVPFPAIPEYDYTNRGHHKTRKLLLEKDENGLPVFRKEVALLAVPAGQVEVDTANILDLSGYFDPESGELNWQAPAGEWEVTRYVCVNLGIPLKIPSPNSDGLMIDHMSAKAIEEHTEFFINQLAPYVEDIENSALKYLYNDSYEVKGPVWTENLPQEFKERRGYDLIKFIPALKGKVVVNQAITDRFMYDYDMTLSDLTIENHYRKGREVAGKYGLGYSAESGGPGPPAHPNVPVESIKALGNVSAPRGEFWHKSLRIDAQGYDSHLFIKGIASAAHLYDQKFVEAESFTSTKHWQEGWQDLKPTVDEAFCEGLNRIVFHTGTHSPDRFGVPGYVYAFGTHINTTQTWWPKAKAWMDYLARSSYLLQEGRFAGDLLYYYGDQTPNFAVQRHEDPTLGFGYDYDVINTEKLLELEVNNGKLTLPHGQEYKLLVLPQQQIMPLKVLEKIEQLLTEGALVVGPKPERTPGLHNYQQNEQQLKELADKLWQGLSPSKDNYNEIGKGKLYWGAAQRKILWDHQVYPDFNFKGDNDSTDLNFLHRKTDNQDIYYVRNTRNILAVAECIFRVKDKIPQLWIPETGEIIEDLIYNQQGDSIRVALSFAPHDAYFILFSSASDKKAVNRISKDEKIIFPSQSSYAEIKGYEVKAGSFSIPGNYHYIYANGDSSTVAASATKQLKIEGSWQLSFQEKWGPESFVMPKLISWSEAENEKLKYYSGIAQYQIEFDLKEIQDDSKYLLDLGEVREVADVKLNGDSVGLVWHQPFQIDISNQLKEGKNTLIIEVANVWNNRLVGDGKLPEEERYTNTNIVNGPTAWGDPWAKVPLKTSGLIGPVVIKIFENK
jgi:hypothetical protein